MMLFVTIVLSALWTMWKAMRRSLTLKHPDAHKLFWACFGVTTGLVAVLVYGATGTLLYIEYLWWFLGLPVCMHRTVENIELEVAESQKIQHDELETAADAGDIAEPAVAVR